MADYSAPVQWLVVAIALASSLWVGWLRRGPRGFGKIASSVVLAVIWGLCFTFVAVYAHALCISSFHLCPNRGDGNMSYWFFPLFATPVYLICLLAFGSRDESLVIEPSPFDEAVDAAVKQLQSQNKIQQRCPNCNAVIFAESGDKAKTSATHRVYLRCACGKCDRLFDLLIKAREAGDHPV